MTREDHEATSGGAKRGSDSFAASLARAGLLTSCREISGDGDRCSHPAEFILWGKMINADGLGPRCYDHAAKHVGHRALGNPQWAIADLRPLRKSWSDDTSRTDGVGAS